MRLFFSIVTLCLVCACPAASQAAPIENFWEVSLPVPDRSEQQRRAAMPALLRAIVLKAVGDRQVIQEDWLRSMLADPWHYLRAYRYRNRPSSVDAGQSDTELVASFSPVLLASALEKAKIVPWGQHRPVVLPWVLSLPREGMPVFLGLETSNWQVDAMRATASERGLELVIPLQDLADQEAIGIIDIRGSWQQRIMDASQRYGTQSIWYGSLVQGDDGRWQARWTLLLGEQIWQWTEEGLAEEKLLKRSVHGMVDLVARHYLQAAQATTGVATDFLIRVRGIDSFKQQVEILDHLRGIGQVKLVQMEMLDGDQINYRLRSASRAFVLESIALGELLQPKSTNGIGSDFPEYDYRGRLGAD
ncbi:MAG: DUF2066 domain-containing protein [Candidatus Eutrophobiaceae bacterium]